MYFFNNNYYEHYGGFGLAGIAANISKIGKESAAAADLAKQAGKIAKEAGAAGELAKQAGKIAKEAGAAGELAKEASKISKQADIEKAAGKGSVLGRNYKDLGINYEAYPAGTRERRLSYDNYLKSQIKPPNILNNTDSITKIEKDLNELGKLDDINNIDNIDNINPETKKLVKETPENIKADLTPEGKVKVEEIGGDLLKHTDTPEFKKKTFKEKYESVKKYVAEHPKLIASIGLATVIGSVFLGLHIKSQSDANRINNTDYKITSITSDKGLVTVLYEPRDVFTLNSKILISESNSIPDISNRNISLNYVGNGIITFNGDEITKKGTSGKFRCDIKAEDIFQKDIHSITDTATNIITDIPIGVSKTLLDKLIPQPLKDFFTNWWWVVLIICILSIISSSAAAAFLYLK